MSVSINGTNGLVFNDASTQNTAATGFGFKNRIINGAMMIAQRGTGVITADTSNQFPVDRMKVNGSTSGKMTSQQNQNSVTPPTGFTNYLGITSSSAYSVPTGEAYSLNHIIEGYNISDLGWGAVGASAVTLSFWTCSSLTGTFGGVIRNGAGSRSYAFTFVINSANTWEQKSITITGDTSGTWATDNTGGLILVISMGCGASLLGTPGSWAATTYFGATGQTNLVGTNGATFYITGVQLEKGSTATSFDYRPYGTELQLAQRYTYKMMRGWQLPKMRESNRSRTNSFQHPVQMRAAPSIPSLATTDGITLTLWEITDKGFYGECVVPGDGYGASVNTEAIVSAEL